MDQSDNSIIYEFPCNERVRTHLRLEYLFERMDWLASQSSPIAHQCAISALFDLVDATARSDLRNELIQELERHRQNFYSLRKRDDVDQVRLEETMADIANAIHTIANATGKSGQNIRENEWLMTIRARLSIPGGVCQFDMPALYHWFQLAPELRREELYTWFANMLPTKHAVSLILRLLRSSCVQTEYTVDNGSLQVPLNGQAYALARVWTQRNSNIIPELSANKYMLWLRFSRPDERHKLHSLKESLTFTLGLCSI